MIGKEIKIRDQDQRLMMIEMKRSRCEVDDDWDEEIKIRD